MELIHMGQRRNKASNKLWSRPSTAAPTTPSRTTGTPPSLCLSTTASAALLVPKTVALSSRLSFATSLPLKHCQSRKSEVHRGMRKRPWGRFTAKIRDPRRRRESGSGPSTPPRMQCKCVRRGG